MDFNEIILVVIAFFAAGLISFASTPLVRVFAYKIGAVDIPKDNRRMHTKPIPRLGGLAIFFGFMVSVLLFCKIDTQIKGIILGAIIIVVLGIFDDVFALGAKFKFVIQIIAALIPVLSGVTIENIINLNIFSDSQYWDLKYLSIPISILWIVAITNAVNLIDGLDGLAAGVSSIASFSLLIITIMTAQDPVIPVIVAALTGSCIGFIPYNLNPARIFMGDTGATFLGFILACCSIQGPFKSYMLVSFVVPFLILGLPIFDTAYAIIRRIATGHSPMKPDRGHLHHKLIDMGFSQKQAVAILYSISGILGLAAVLLATDTALKALMIVVAAFIIFLFAANILMKKNSNLDNNDSDDDISQNNSDKSDNDNLISEKEIMQMEDKNKK